MTPIRTLRPLAKVVLSTQSDDRLVALAREGSEDAFAEIVRRHRPGLLRLARSLGSGDRADDVVQDGLVRAWRALQRSDAEIDLRPWLATIVRNRAMTAHSTNRTHEELDETIDGVRQPGDIVIMREELRSAVSAVNALPESQREALVRSALAGESHDQIASALATSPGAVRQLIFRARTGLREAVGAIIPLPLVRALVETGAGGAAVGAGAAMATAGGASIGLKAVAIVVVGATVAGTGVAIERQSGGAEAKAPTETTTVAEERRQATEQDTATVAADESAKSAGSAEQAQAAEPVALKSAEATPSATLSTGGGSDGDNSRAAASTSDGDDGSGQDAAQEPQPTNPPHQDQPTDGHHGPQQSGHDGPRDGEHQPPPPPPPPADQQPPPPDQDGYDGDGHDGYDGRHGGGGQYPSTTSDHDGSYGGNVALGDLLAP